MKQTRKETTVKFRHSRENEPPLPVVGLKVHSKRRKKALTADLHTKGLSIGYDGVMDIHSSLAQKVNEEYNAKGNVVPPQLHKNLFTNDAIDNFDYNVKYSTAISIHYTGNPLFQHPVEASPFRFESNCAS